MCSIRTLVYLRVGPAAKQSSRLVPPRRNLFQLRVENKNWTIWPGGMHRAGPARCIPPGHMLNGTFSIRSWKRFPRRTVIYLFARARARRALEFECADGYFSSVRWVPDLIFLANSEPMLFQHATKGITFNGQLLTDIEPFPHLISSRTLFRSWPYS